MATLENELPSHIGRYEIKELLGAGGMAEVYLAYDPNSKRNVATKVIRDSLANDPAFRQRFNREIRFVANLEHPSIVPVYDVDEYDGKPFLVMQWMTGGSLRERLIREGALDPSEANLILRQLVAALEAAHEKNIIHRDIKPENVLMDGEGKPNLADFGIARVIKQTGNLTSTVIGTPDYMAPEQWNQERLDKRTDVYQLGVMLFEMLTGQRPFQAHDLATLMDKHLGAEVPSVQTLKPELSLACDDVLRRAMAKAITERYATPSELASALARALRLEKINNRYPIIRTLGHGPISTVYLVDDPQTKQEQALKIMQAKLRPGLAFERRWNREKQAIMSLKHEAIVPVYDIDLHENQPYLTMRQMQNSLHARLRSENPLPLNDVFRVAERVAAALDIAHREDIHHGDVKPSNVLYDAHGLPYLSNFGTVRIVEQTETDEVDLRSFSYMAPEQWQAREETAKTDIYQFAVMLFEILTGRRPFEDDDLDGLERKHLYEPVPSAKALNPDLPPKYDELLRQAMAKQPEDRFETASELAVALTQAERQFTLASFYNAGRDYYHQDKWQEAINAFEETQEIQTDYEDVQAYIARAQEHRRKTESFSRGQKILAEGRWEDAANLLKPLGEYRGANVALAEAERQMRLAERYREGLTQYQRKNWIAAKVIFDEIDDLDPNYEKVDDLRQEVEQHIYKIFHEGRAALDSGRFQSAINHFGEITGYEAADNLYKQAKRKLEIEDFYKVGLQEYEYKNWNAARKAFLQVERLESNYKNVRQLLRECEQNRFWWQRLNRDRIAFLLTLLGLFFAIAFDFFGIGYTSLRQFFQEPAPIVEPTPTLKMLEDCLATAVPILTVQNIGDFNQDETIALTSETAEFELSLQSETCSQLRERTFFDWSNEDMTIERFPSAEFLAQYNAPCNECIDEIHIEVSIPFSTASKTYEFTLNINR